MSMMPKVDEEALERNKLYAKRNHSAEFFSRTSSRLKTSELLHRLDGQ
jgi:hypothetical protein